MDRNLDAGSGIDFQSNPRICPDHGAFGRDDGRTVLRKASAGREIGSGSADSREYIQEIRARAQGVQASLAAAMADL